MTMVALATAIEDTFGITRPIALALQRERDFDKRLFVRRVHGAGHVLLVNAKQLWHDFEINHEGERLIVPNFGQRFTAGSPRTSASGLNPEARTMRFQTCVANGVEATGEAFDALV